MSACARLLALDQGTTSTRAVLVGADGTPLASAQRELPQSFPHDGWVEHDAERIAEDAIGVMIEVLHAAGTRAEEITALGISNQRETVVVWERASGRAIHPAIVWQDRRTAERCEELRAAGHEAEVTAATGLLLDPYFSATKLAWILDAVPQARTRAERGELAAGTIDSWLAWRLTGGALHVTDASNASRTSLYDLRTQAWSEELCALFRVPLTLLAQVRDTAADYGATERALFGAPLPLHALVGDQQAACFGQACLAPGSMKATFGSGGFTMSNTGTTMLRSQHRLLTTQAWRLNGASTFALEGSFFHAGTAVQWLRDGLGVLRDVGEIEALVRAADPAKRVYLVPAFTGLGAPWWRPDARGAVFGLTRDASAADLARAALEACCFQTRDLLDAARADGASVPEELRVDGGMVRNDWLLQALADLCGLPVARQASTECTARGAALLAGIGAGLEESAAASREFRAEKRCEPRMSEDERADRHAGWLHAVSRTLAEA